VKTQKFIKAFEFSASMRRRIETSPGVRIDPALGVAGLVEGVDGFPMGAGHTVRTWVTNPTASREWLMLEVVGVRPAGTFIRFRLSDGSSDFFWNGGAWVAASGPAEWSTEAELSANMREFPAGPLQIVASLETTNPKRTPSIAEIKVLFEGVLFAQEDLLIRTLLRTVREDVRPVGEFAIRTIAAGTMISLAEIETPYDIVGVDSAFDADADPDLRRDVAASYDAPSRTLTLSKAIPAGRLVRVRFTYAPPVMFTTGQNYVELAKVPAITITGSTGTRRPLTKGPSVIDRATGKGWQLPPPVHVDFDLTLKFVSDKLQDHMRLADAVREFLGRRSLIRLSGLDEDTPLRVISDYDQDSASQGDLHSGRIRARLDRALIVFGDATEVVSVRSMNVAL
jgi:hypothetical protein